MNSFNFTQWLAIVTPIVTLTGAMYYLLREDMKQLALQHREDNNIVCKQLADNQNHWADLLKSFCDFKNVTVERFAKLENKDQ